MAKVVKSYGLSEQQVAEGFNVTRIAVTDAMSIQQWSCEPGASFPEHSHVHEQIGYVYSGGEMTLTVAGETYVVGSGDTYFVESNEAHAGTNHSNETVHGVDIFNPPLTDDDWIK